MAREVARITTLDIQVEGWSGDRQVALQRMANARIAIGIGISDGIGTSFLEAMALGAFPIAATTACAAEWVRNGVDGLVVDPHDVNALAQAIVRAATDDVMVDAASLRNRCEVEQRWNVQVNRELALRMYEEVIAGIHDRRLR
jgi:glycosyltransferase involved in cell wall biosynthesis